MRMRNLLVSPSLSGVLLLTLLSTGSAPAATTDLQYRGGAFGSLATVGNAVISGQSFPVNLGGCGTLRPPVSRSNTGGTVNAQPGFTTGGIDTTVSATDVGGTRTARGSATVHAVNVLSGLITADEIRAVSATSNDSRGFHVDATGSRLVRLAVAGVPVVVAASPNTRITLPGFGHAILNEQVASIQATSASLFVNMLHVFVTLPNPLVPVGTNIIVSHAKSSLESTSLVGTLDGFAYGSMVREGRRFLSGKSALVELGCAGTNGAIDQNVALGISFAPHFATSAVTNTVSGVVDTRSASGETTSTVEAASLLSSLVTADLIKADAHSFTDGNVFSFTDTGSSFVHLSVRGFPEIRDNVAANTRVSLAGLGDLWLRREIVTPNSIEIRMIQLVVTQANAQGIPIGTDIQLGVAHASAH